VGAHVGLVGWLVGRERGAGRGMIRSTFKFSKFTRYFHSQKTILRFSFLFRSTGIIPWTGFPFCRPSVFDWGTTPLNFYTLLHLSFSQTNERQRVFLSSHFRELASPPIPTLRIRAFNHPITFTSVDDSPITPRLLHQTSVHRQSLVVSLRRCASALLLL
jgi:hypothetical protein